MSLTRTFCCVAALLFARLAAAQGSAAASTFPESWAGVWRGTMTIYGAADSIKMTVPAVLTISRESSTRYRWRTVYANDTTRGMKDYHLVVLDAAAGRYATDENNGLLIDDMYIGGMLVSVFQVGDQVLENRYTMHGDSLVQDLIFWKNTPVRTTGGTGPNGERGTPVMAFRVAGRQRVVMRRDVPR